MTWTLRAPPVPKLGISLFFLTLLVACANFLGIEERKEDTAANYPSAGYAGCRPGNSCEGCLDVHRQECQVRTACASAAGNDDCAGCVCQNCENEVVDCQLDAGCAAIWQCLRETRCDLSERASGNCLEACGSAIQAGGGLNGAAFRAAAEIRACAATAACLTCLAPQVQQSARECTQDNACQDCDTCFDQCLCSGERFGECQRLCGQDAPDTSCSEDDDCQGCTNCFDACACGGVGYDACVDLCTTPGPDPGPDPNTCNAETSCVDCTGCVAQCVCSGGGDEAQCSSLCGPPPREDACVESSQGQTSSCGGCQSCVASYTCNGSTVAEASHYACGTSDCCETGNCGQFDWCTCGDSEANCFNYWWGACDNYAPCEKCACERCPGELGMCWEVSGCQETFDCMRATNCQGSACLERCRGSDYPPEAFAFAEALWACFQGAQCTGCAGNAPAVVECATTSGIAQCPGYQGYGFEIGPCCASMLGGGTTPLPPIETEPATTPDDNACGLQLNRYYSNARSCEPRAQLDPPRYELLETCPDMATFSGQPYFGAVMKGCCRGADNTCGFFDDVSGLGCLSVSLLGYNPQACP